MINRFSVNDKVIIVTGATGVLGHSFIKALAVEGAVVGVLGRNEKVANERVKEITGKEVRRLHWWLMLPGKSR